MVASAFGGTFLRKCELIYQRTKKKDINIIKTNFFTLARDSAVNKAVPASSLSVTFDLDCSPAVTKNNLFQK